MATGLSAGLIKKIRSKAKLQQAGTEEMVRTIGPGQFFGEIGLLLAGQRTATVDAKNYGVVNSVSHESLFSLIERFPLFKTVVMHHILSKYDDQIQMFLRAALSQIEFLKGAKKETIALIAFRMIERNFEQGQFLFDPNTLSKEMFIVFDGVVELNLHFDKTDTKIALERLGRGGIINPLNFLVEERIDVTAEVVS